MEIERTLLLIMVSLSVVTIPKRFLEHCISFLKFHCYATVLKCFCFLIKFLFAPFYCRVCSIPIKDASCINLDNKCY